MTPEEAVSYIEHYTWSSTRLGLERTRALLAAMGEPQKRLKFVHVAGSNGKGSTCAMLASILRRAGYRTGLYTSPYLQDFCERIQVDGQNIPRETLAAITARVRNIADAMDDHPSQFELVTAIAMAFFADTGCDIVVLEVGMGGALDSTNVIDAPEVAVITNITLEHTEYLGGTLREIAAAKAGTIKPGCDAVVYPGAPEVMETVAAVCAENGVPLRRADFSALRTQADSLDGQVFSYRGLEALRLPLLGAHQLRNAVVALTCVEALRARGWSIPDGAVRCGLAETKWPARLEALHREPLFLLDGGHNPQCAEALARCMETYLPGQRATVLMGVLADKDVSDMLRPMLPHAARFLCLTPDNPRALPAAELREAITALGGDAAVADSVADGICLALERGGPVVAFGSLYLAGEIRSAFPRVCKRVQRRACLDARGALSPEDRAAASQRIVRAILASAQYRRAKTILLYKAFGSEVDLSALETQALRDGKRLVFPCCADRTTMLALAPRGADAWRRGAFGIREPTPEGSDRVAPEALDLVLCPCSGFDAARHRLGMGAGYYDRFLPQCANAAVCAVAFEAQRLDQICTEATDIPMQAVFTERAVYTSDEAGKETLKS